MASCSTLRIGPYLFYLEKFTTLFNTAEKKMICHHAGFGEKKRFTFLARSSRKEKAAIF